MQVGKIKYSLNHLLAMAIGQMHIAFRDKRSVISCLVRFKPCLADAGDYLLACQRQIELNLLGAGTVAAPAG